MEGYRRCPDRVLVKPWRHPGRVPVKVPMTSRSGPNEVLATSRLGLMWPNQMEGGGGGGVTPKGWGWIVTSKPPDLPPIGWGWPWATTTHCGGGSATPSSLILCGWYPFMGCYSHPLGWVAIFFFFFFFKVFKKIWVL
jgi:hypothetical protein